MTTDVGDETVRSRVTSEQSFVMQIRPRSQHFFFVERDASRLIPRKDSATLIPLRLHQIS